MNFGKLIKKHGESFIKDLTTEDLHHVENAEGLQIGDYYTYEINENDDAVELQRAADYFLSIGYNMNVASFYVSDEDEVEAEAYFGTCEFTGMKGDIVPCRTLDTSGNVVEFNAGTWLVHSVLEKLAGAF